jgi:Fic family protein
MFYLSEYLEKNRVYYYQNLQNISQNEDWDSWIEFFLKAVIEQSKENTDKAKEINKLYEKKKERIVDLTHSQFAIKTLDFIFCSPIFTSTQFFERSYIPKQSAIRILNLLKEGGVIEIIVKGKSRQPNVYIFKKLLNIIK